MQSHPPHRPECVAQRNVSAAGCSSATSNALEAADMQTQVRRAATARQDAVRASATPSQVPQSIMALLLEDADVKLPRQGCAALSEYLESKSTEAASAAWQATHVRVVQLMQHADREIAAAAAGVIARFAAYIALADSILADAGPQLQAQLLLPTMGSGQMEAATALCALAFQSGAAVWQLASDSILAVLESLDLELSAAVLKIVSMCSKLNYVAPNVLYEALSKQLEKQIEFRTSFSSAYIVSRVVGPDGLEYKMDYDLVYIVQLQCRLASRAGKTESLLTGANLQQRLDMLKSTSSEHRCAAAWAFSMLLQPPTCGAVVQQVWDDSGGLGTWCKLLASDDSSLQIASAGVLQHFARAQATAPALWEKVRPTLTQLMLRGDSDKCRIAALDVMVAMTNNMTTASTIADEISLSAFTAAEPYYHKEEVMMHLASLQYADGQAIWALLRRHAASLLSCVDAKVRLFAAAAIAANGSDRSSMWWCNSLGIVVAELGAISISNVQQQHVILHNVMVQAVFNHDRVKSAAAAIGALLKKDQCAQIFVPALAQCLAVWVSAGAPVEFSGGTHAVARLAMLVAVHAADWANHPSSYPWVMSSLSLVARSATVGQQQFNSQLAAAVKEALQSWPEVLNPKQPELTRKGNVAHLTQGLPETVVLALQKDVAPVEVCRVLSASVPMLFSCCNPACSARWAVNSTSWKKLNKCGECKAAGYCCQQCLKDDWRSHKPCCKILSKP